MKELTTQIAVIAAGPAGLCAAVQAAQDGAQVIVLEKTSKVGGAANLGMGILGLETKYQKRQMLDVSVEKAFNMFMEYTHYQVDGRLLHRYFSQSAETIEWLEEMGVEFEGAYPYFPKSEATWHIVKTGRGIGPGAATLMNRLIAARAEELGVQILFKTPANKIVMEDGRVVGVLATDADGEELMIHCRAAVVATGGTGANPQMLKEETGYTYGKDMFSFAIPGLTGDGLRMAWEAGAAKLPVRVEQAASVEGTNGLPQSVANVFGQPNLLVNRHGKRIMNEEHMQNSTYLSNVVSKQKDRMGFSIVDSSIVDGYIENGVDVVSLVRTDPKVDDFAAGIDKAMARGSECFCKADTIEELAEKMGINVQTLVKTVKAYNQYCASYDEEFFKPRKFLKPIVKAPFYCGRIRPGGYGTVGGIRINENCEAVGEDFEPVTGLYAAGADACNIYDDSYMFLLPGNSMGYAVNTGRIAGKEAAVFVKQ